eukprot:scaffold180846_cov31-Prasinocladus_malaysianus.AAC.4
MKGGAKYGRTVFELVYAKAKGLPKPKAAGDPPGPKPKTPTKIVFFQFIEALEMLAQRWNKGLADIINKILANPYVSKVVTV